MSLEKIKIISCFSVCLSFIYEDGSVFLVVLNGAVERILG